MSQQIWLKIPSLRALWKIDSCQKSSLVKILSKKIRDQKKLHKVSRLNATILCLLLGTIYQTLHKVSRAQFHNQGFTLSVNPI